MGLFEEMTDLNVEPTLTHLTHWGFERKLCGK